MLDILEKLKLNTATIYEDLSPAKLITEAVKRGEGILCSNGALSIHTGKCTGRSPKDRYIVCDETTKDNINWGDINLPIEQSKFDGLLNEVKDYLKEKDLFVFNGRVGASEDYSIGVQSICEYASQSLFCRQLFIREKSNNKEEGFTVLSAPGFKADAKKYSLNSEVFIIINFTQRIVLIGGTQYSGEIKKAMFTAMNYFLPFKGVLPMHCSANEGKDGDVAILFGLSGTGKTTLSADPERALIGDDEHGWSKTGIFNFEGGCYAKTIDLSREKERDIYDAIRFGSILENVILDSDNNPIYDNGSITENTRGSYPIYHINNVKSTGNGGVPKVILFLTADAFGVLPPIARLNKEQAMYYFLSGYTSKVAGTERGLKEPQATFSTCFGAPFMPMNPKVYAELLGDKIEEYNVRVYMVNTGWIGGSYGVGNRIALKYTRTLVKAAINGELEKEHWVEDEYFNLMIPVNCPGVPSEILKPQETWANKEDYKNTSILLKEKFEQNYKKYSHIEIG